MNKGIVNGYEHQHFTNTIQIEALTIGSTAQKEHVTFVNNVNIFVS